MGTGNAQYTLIRPVMVLEVLGEEVLCKERNLLEDSGTLCSDNMQKLFQPSGNHRRKQSGL